MYTRFLPFFCLALFTLVATNTRASTSPSHKNPQKVPLAFERNVGQARFTDGSDASYVDAIVRLGNTIAYVHKRGIHIGQSQIVRDPASPKHDAEYDLETFRVDMELIASNPTARLEWLAKSPGIVRHITPGTGVNGLVANRYETMVYHDVWQGIDLRMFFTERGVKYDFVVHPGANASNIAFRYVGGSQPTVQANGDILVTTPLGSIGENAPVVYELGTDGSRGRTIVAGFDVRGSSVRFDVAKFDGSATLIIDPQRVWGTYYGYNQNIETPQIAVDPLGNVIISGTTQATNMPSSPGVFQRRIKGGFDGFVTKFSETGKFIWHTFYGGSTNDRLRDVATDAAGNIWACGQSDSKDLPNLNMGSGPYGDPDSIEFAEAIVLRLTPAGAWDDSWQIYGRNSDVATGIAVTPTSIAVVGYTRSPRLGNLFGDAPYRKDSTNFFNNTDMFLSVVKPKVNQPGKWSHNYLIFYGGGAEDFGSKVAFDQNGDIIFSGITYSANFPVTDGSTYKTLEDFAVVKFGPTPVRQWSTMFGSTGDDDYGDMAVDGTGATIIVGGSWGVDFPTLIPLQAARGRGFITAVMRKLAPNGTALWSTYYGGDSLSSLHGVSTDRSNNVWIAGYTNRSLNALVTADAFQLAPNALFGTDGYFAKINPGGTIVLYGTHYGAPPQDPLPPLPTMANPTPPPPNSDFGMDALHAIVCDNNAYVAMIGLVSSYRMDTTAGAFQDSSQLSKDTVRSNGFVSFFSNCKDSVVEIVPNGPPTLCDADTRQLVAPAGFARYLWSTSGTTRAIVVSDSGTYSVLCTTLDGCRYRDTIRIFKNSKPSVNAGKDTSICINGTVLVTAIPSGGKSPYTYKWNRIQPGTEFIDNDTLQSPTLRPNEPSFYEVTVTDSAGCKNKDTMFVNVIDPKPTYQPVLIDFGALDACASSAEQDIAITNSMTYEIRISGFTPSTPSLSLVTSLATPIIVPAGGTATLRLRCSPTTAGTLSGTFNFSGTPCAWALLGNFKAVKAQLTATVIPGTLSFGAGVICQQIAKTDSAVIRNGGTDVLVVKPGTVSAPFSLISPTTSVSIPPGEQRTVVIQYSPAGAGSFNSVAKFPFTSGSCSDTLRINCNAITSEVTVTSLPSSINLGTLSGCETERDTTITLNNTSSVAVTVTLPSTAELIFNPAGPVPIPASSSIDVRVTVRPAAAGAFLQTATLVAQPCALNIPVAFSAQKNGIAFTTPSSVDFGEFSQCSPTASTKRTSSLSFDGTGTATVSSITLGSTLGATLASGLVLTPGVSVPFDVTWTPIAEGPLVDSIVVVFDPCAVRRVIRVTGMRTRASLRSDNPAVALGNIPGSATGTVRFTNDGSDTIRVGVASISTNTFVTTTRPANLTDILPGAQIEVDYQVNCAARTSVLDSLEALVIAPCASSAYSQLTGTCSSTINAQSTIVVDTAAVNIGQQFSIPIRIESSQGLNANNLKLWTADVTYNPMIVVGAGGGTPDCYVSGQFTPCTISISGTRGTDTVGKIYSLDFKAVLGTSDMTMLTLSNFRWTNGPTAQVSSRDGKVVIKDICREAGDRFLNPKLSGFTLSVFPTPASTDFTIEVKGAGTAPIPWRLSNYVGVDIATGTISPDATGLGTAVVDVRAFAQGLYLLSTDARGTTYRNTVLIQR